jgi:hypothetical protein
MLQKKYLLYLFMFFKKYDLINYEIKLNNLIFNYIIFIDIIWAIYFKYSLLEIKFIYLYKKYLSIFRINKKFKSNIPYLLKNFKNYLNNLMFYNIYENCIQINKHINDFNINNISNFKIIFFINFLNSNFLKKNNYYNKFSLYFLIKEKKKKWWKIVPSKKKKYFFCNIFSLFFFNLFIYFLLVYLFIYWFNNIFKLIKHFNKYFLFEILKKNKFILFYIKKLNYSNYKSYTKNFINENKNLKKFHYCLNNFKLNKYYLAFNKLNLFKI